MIWTPYTEIPIRNLIYHIYPVKKNEELWRWHVSEILKRKHIFNGRKIISIATDGLSSTKKEVEDAFGDEFEFVHVLNSKNKGEASSFIHLLQKIISSNTDEITFYAHAKGVSYLSNKKKIGASIWHEPEVIKHWSDQMYKVNLDHIELVDKALESHGTCGSFRRNQKLGGISNNGWYYSGAFFWFRNLFVQKKNWKNINKTKIAAEAWPGTLFSVNEAACLFGDDIKSLYLKNEWKSIDSQVDNSSKKSTEMRVKSDVELTLITPTGDRPESFALCEKWMSKQTYSEEYQWIVVDDGLIPTKVTMNQQYIRRSSDTKIHTLTANLRAALRECKGEKVLIIEDDEWYHPNYLKVMSERLDDHELVGTGMARYYYIRERLYREFPEHTHSSLCRTGFRKSLIEKVFALCQTSDPSVDMRLWESVKGYREETDVPLVIGFKGMPGRKVKRGKAKGIEDSNLSKLKEWIGRNIKYYKSYFKSNFSISNDVDFTVYTVILNRYDKLKNPKVINPNCKYVCFVDKLFTDKSLIWEQRVISKAFSRDPRIQSRYLKMHSHELFPKSDWTLYLDGQMQLLVDPFSLLNECISFGSSNMYLFDHHERNCLYTEADAVVRIGFDSSKNVRSQIEKYKEDGYLKENGLYLGGLLLRNRKCINFNNVWWSNFINGSIRDQISLPWALEKSGVKFKNLPAMWWENYFERTEHIKRRVTVRR